MPCQGRNNEEHCCYVHGEVCPHLEENTEPGFRWSCGLRRELGNWDAVLADPRYPKDSWAPGVNCRDWPEGPAKYRGCNTCGACKD